MMEKEGGRIYSALIVLAVLAIAIASPKIFSGGFSGHAISIPDAEKCIASLNRSIGGLSDNFTELTQDPEKMNAFFDAFSSALPEAIQCLQTWTGEFEGYKDGVCSSSPRSNSCGDAIKEYYTFKTELLTMQTAYTAIPALKKALPLISENLTVRDMKKIADLAIPQFPLITSHLQNNSEILREYQTEACSSNPQSVYCINATIDYQDSLDLLNLSSAIFEQIKSYKTQIDVAFLIMPQTLKDQQVISLSESEFSGFLGNSQGNAPSSQAPAPSEGFFSFFSPFIPLLSWAIEVIVLILVAIVLAVWFPIHVLRKKGKQRKLVGQLDEVLAKAKSSLQAGDSSSAMTSYNVLRQSFSSYQKKIPKKEFARLQGEGMKLFSDLSKSSQNLT